MIILDDLSEFESWGLVTRTFRRLDPERRESLVAAILEEAAETGPADLSIKKVAARAGMAVGSLYTYFANRDGMLSFAIELVKRRMTDECARYRHVLTTMPLNYGLKWYLKTIVEWSDSNSSMARFFAHATYHGNSDLLARLVEPVSRERFSMIQDMLESAQSRGEIRHDADLPSIIRVIFTLTTSLTDAIILPDLNRYLLVTAEQNNADVVLTSAVNLILNGVVAEVVRAG